MANNLKSFIEVKGNEEVVKYVDSLIDKVEDNKDDSPITSFAKAFYDNVELSENGGVMNDWSYKNLGPKWTQLYDIQGEATFSIESAWYPPKEFFFHLYNLCFPLDNNVVIEVKYEDEGFDPVGAMAIKGIMTENENEEMVLMGHAWGEETTLEDPTEDMDWEDEDYDQTQMEFYETLAETQDQLLSECLRLVETDGMLFEDYDSHQ